MKKILLLGLIAGSFSMAWADEFGKGEYTTEGPGQCYPGLMECYSDGSSHFPTPATTSFDECVKTANGRAYRWLNSFRRCLGSDGPNAG